MVEDCSDIPVGIVVSISIYSVYIYIADKLIQVYKLDNWIMFIIYFVPFIILYIEIPAILRKSNNRQKYID
jgi:hypothetical protein